MVDLQRKNPKPLMSAKGRSRRFGRVRFDVALPKGRHPRCLAGSLAALNILAKNNY
jgi:hypothetical protein